MLDRKHIPSNTGDSVEILLVLERSHAALGEVYDLDARNVFGHLGWVPRSVTGAPHCNIVEDLTGKLS